MKNIFFAGILFLFFGMPLLAQHQSKIKASINLETKVCAIQQHFVYHNQSSDTLSEIVFNDWMHAFSGKKTPLAKRFANEFYNGFFLAAKSERGGTTFYTITNQNNENYTWNRLEKTPDMVQITLQKKLAPGEMQVLNFVYDVKIPNAKFTKYGFENATKVSLKNWILSPAIYEKNAFVTYNNYNLDDCPSAICDYEIEVALPTNLVLTTDLNISKTEQSNQQTNYFLQGKQRKDFCFILEPKSSFTTFSLQNQQIVTNIAAKKVDPIIQSEIVERIRLFTNNAIGEYPHEKIIVSQTDYDINPFYGLSQLPRFLNAFSPEFNFEIKFLKTYLATYLKNSLRIDSRKNNWIANGIQMYTLMRYIEKYHPEVKMLGNLSKYKLLKSYNVAQVSFNQQFSYAYLLMTRANANQSLLTPKDKLVRFNEKIAEKYHAGLALKYLEAVTDSTHILKSNRLFFALNKTQNTQGNVYEQILRNNTTSNIDWFFEEVIGENKIIDYKLKIHSKTKDSVSFSLINKEAAKVPMPIYGLRDKQIVFKKWLYPSKNDSIYSITLQNASKLVLNYKNEVPENNARNNWKSLSSFFGNNRPFKLNFLKDIENPQVNQLIYVPSVNYNLYDGITLGLRLSNRTLLEKPFHFDVTPSFSSGTQTVTAGGYVAYNQYYRDSKLKNIRYTLSSSYFHYAPDATYLKINPSIVFVKQNEDRRDNRYQALFLREVIVNREKSAFVSTTSDEENYAVFNAKYFNSKKESTNLLSFVNDFQIASKFGKIASEIEYRQRFEDNRQLSLRFYGGTFLYNSSKTSFFDFALDRPTDYLFDYNYYGRSESTGFFSNQLIIAEGGFKSKLPNAYANQWITTINTSYSVWNWIEMYSDLGFLKNKNTREKWVYDGGIRLNIAPDYFEIYLPVFSNNGLELSQKNYSEKIRFVLTLNPKVLLSLFNRKWF